MHRYVLGLALTLGTLGGFAGEAPEEAPERGEAPAERRPTPVPQRDRENEPATAERSGVSLEDATAIVRQAYGGRVVSSSKANARPAPRRPEEPGYRVRVDIDGRVKTVFVDARGRIHENAEF
ncbi:MAG: PepSY domain-containing protein [Gammaproteobacteria bacterium]|nr:PepSY domain-containing protein [Gammaproteobacteria bacterium]